MIGSTIELELQRKGITQHALAEASGLTAAAISQIVAGQREPSLKSILKICTALNTTPNDLLGFHSGERLKLRQQVSDLKWRLKEIQRMCRGKDD